ncbi:FlgB family protein [Salibaculum sp.]|uniref:FlgB family protein n=1 Tax=Salibaculum sp. TaxID=2855480 RepID=UPI002B46CFC1|nr:FlgB family protein [Salibaculum sp.]HKL68108.1 FlgB family protein [Salibaculum sp.]
MFNSLDVLQTAMDMARHAGARQAVTAANLANADTPGYRARSIAPFSEVYDSAPTGGLHRTRPGHLSTGQGFGSAARPEFTDADPAPNGNSVSIEQEMLSAVEIGREHSRALTIYQHSLEVLRLSIGRR